MSYFVTPLRWSRADGHVTRVLEVAACGRRAGIVQFQRGLWQLRPFHSDRLQHLRLLPRAAEVRRDQHAELARTGDLERAGVECAVGTQVELGVAERLLLR